MQNYRWYIFICIIALLLINNWSIPLWDQDEAAYAGFGYMMNKTGNWLIPDFMFSEVHRKPPLHFWNIALSYKIFGYNEFAVRFPSFLAILGTLLLMWFQGKKILASNIAFRSVTIIAGSFLVTAIAKISVTDATVLFTSTLCAFGIINTLRKPQWGWVFLFWLGFALGILTKGPPIIIFVGAFAGILFLLHPLRMNLLKLHPWFFLPLAIAPAFLWGYLTYLNDGGTFLKWMYNWYVLQRINGQVFGQTGPAGTHFLAMCLFFLPFLLHIPHALATAGKGLVQKNEAYTLLFSWFVAGWLLYEFSPSKLPAYVIAAHVPFAFLIALRMENRFPFTTTFDKFFTVAHFSLQFIIATALCTVPFYLGLPQNICILLFILGCILFCSNIYILIKREHLQQHNYQIASALIFVFTAWAIMPHITQLINSSKRVATLVEEKLPKAEQVFIGHNFGKQPSLPFYLLLQERKTINATAYSNEQLLSAYTTHPLSVFILNKDKYETLCASLGVALPFHKVSSLIIDRKGKSDYYLISTPDFRHK